MSTTPSPSRQVRRQQDRAAREDQAQTLIEQLEGRIALGAAERARVLDIANAHHLVEPHRDHHAYALGADQVDCGLTMNDARAMRGLMSIGPAAVADLLDKASSRSPAHYVTRLWPAILATDRPRFEQRGAVVDRRRAEQIGDGSPDQRIVFGRALDRAAAIDGHRDEHAYVLGADMAFCGLVADDALAMMGLMSAGAAHLAQALRAETRTTPNIYVGRLWLPILARSRDDYEARGRFVRWQRRWAQYKTDLDAWLARIDGYDPSWRDLPMTTRQRHLVRDSAILLARAIPEHMNRGAAHDWLMDAGANAIYRKET